MILIPVKNQGNAKQRLSALLTPGERLLLAQAMLEDVLDAVHQCVGKSVDVETRHAASPLETMQAPLDPRHVSLVTSDVHARALAERFGFGVIADAENGGETAAIEMATRVCVERGVEWTLVIPGDTPLITAAELRRVLAARPARGAVLCTDHKGRGSNAVLRAPADLFPLRFGDDSFAPHLRSAEAAGLPVVRFGPDDLPGIALDIDRPEDVAKLLSTVAPEDPSRPVSRQTRAERLLRSWRVDERLLAFSPKMSGAATP